MAKKLKHGARVLGFRLTASNPHNSGYHRAEVEIEEYEACDATVALTQNISSAEMTEHYRARCDKIRRATCGGTIYLDSNVRAPECPCSWQSDSDSRQTDRPWYAFKLELYAGTENLRLAGRLIKALADAGITDAQSASPRDVAIAAVAMGAICCEYSRTADKVVPIEDWRAELDRVFPLPTAPTAVPALPTENLEPQLSDSPAMS